MTVGKKKCRRGAMKILNQNARLTNNEEINIAFFRDGDVKIAQRVISMETESHRGATRGEARRVGCFTSLFFVYANIRL